MLACEKILGISLFESSLRSGVGILWPYAKLFSIICEISTLLKLLLLLMTQITPLFLLNNIMYFKKKQYNVLSQFNGWSWWVLLKCVVAFLNLSILFSLVTILLHFFIITFLFSNHVVDIYTEVNIYSALIKDAKKNVKWNSFLVCIFWQVNLKVGGFIENTIRELSYINGNTEKNNSVNKLQ